MTPETVSAVVTTYNSEAQILRALDSVRAQTRPVDEIVVVDDGSTDRTRALLRDIPDITLVLQENAGPGASRNAGLAAARGSLVAYLDADDLWLPDKTRQQVEHLRRTAADVAVSGGKIWWNEVEDTRRVHPYDPAHHADLRRHLPYINCVGNPSMVMMRRDALAAVGGFDPHIRWGQDWDLWIRLLDRGGIGFLPDNVIIYSWRPGNHSHADPEARLRSFHRVSRGAIERLVPPRRRAAARLRARSGHWADRAALATAQGRRGRALALSAAALASFPFARFPEKVIRLVRSALGESAYRRLRRLYRKPST